MSSQQDQVVLRQLRDAQKRHIADDPTNVTPMRCQLVSDGMGGQVRSGTAEARPAVRVRLAHESGSVQAVSVGPAGLDTNLSLFVETDYRAPLLEGDTFDAFGFTWTVGVVNYFRKGSQVYKTEAPLVKGSAVAVTIPQEFAAEVKSSSAIDLSWSNVGAVNSYWIDRKAGDGAYLNIVTPGAGIFLFHDTGLSPSTTYTYRIRAYNGAAYSAYSAETSATTEAAP
jgi:hypothetical protein